MFSAHTGFPQWMTPVFYQSGCARPRKLFDRDDKAVPNLCSRSERLFRGFQLPREVIQIEEQQRLRICAPKLFECARGPAFRQIAAGFEVLLKKTVLIGNSQKF